MASTMPGLGHLESVLFGVESAAAYGTPVAAGFDLGYVTGGSTDASREIEEIESMGQRNVQELAEIVAKWSGTVDVKYQHARPLWLVLGSVAHTGTVAPFTHTITELNLPPSITIVESHSGLNLKHTTQGVRMKSVKLTISKDKSMDLSLSWTGQKGLSGSTAVANSFSTQSVFPPVQCTAYIGTDKADPTTQLFDIQNGSITIDNNLEELTACNSSYITQLAPTKRSYTGDLELAFESNDMYQRFLGATGADVLATRQTPIAFKISVTDGATPVNSLVLTLYGTKFKTTDRPLTVGGIIYNKFSFTAVSLGACTAIDAISGASFGSAVA